MERTLRGLERTMVQLGGAMGPVLLVARVQGPLPPRILRRAVELLVRRHDTLRVRLDGVRLEVQELAVASVDVVGGDWEGWVQSELGRPLRIEAGECFRVVQVIEDDRVILAAHHALVDGMALQQLLVELLETCAALVDGTGDAPEGPRVPLAPALLDAMPGRWWESLAGAAGAAVGPLVVGAEQRALLADGARQGPLSSGCAFAEGSTRGMDRLRAACAVHGVTVGAAAMAATSFAVGRLRGALGGPLAPVAVEVEVDLRPRAGLAAERLGMLTGGVRTDEPEPDQDFWTLARSVRAEVERDIRMGIPRLAHEVADRLPWTPRDAPGIWAACSNLGRFPRDPRFGPFTVTGLHTLNGAVPGGPAVIVWVHGVGGRLCLSAVGSGPTVDPAALPGVLDDVRRLLEHPAALRLPAWAPAARAA